MNAPSPDDRTIGFIGLGVMGEPICRNLAQKRQSIGFGHLLAYDRRPEPLTRLAASGVEAGASVASIAQASAVIFISLPGGPQLEEVVIGPGGLLETVAPGTIIIDLGTSPVTLTRDLAAQFAQRGASFVDAPVARTREAAERGTLATMVGADGQTFARIAPLLGCFATDVTHCGSSGAGQIVKILNNMVLFETVLALSEALSIAQQAGVEGNVLFDALSRGSADSFALRNHGMKALLPRNFPEQAFSTRYALKDLGYALDLAGAAGLHLAGAEAVRQVLLKTCNAGFGDNYWPAIVEVVNQDAHSAA